MNDHEMEAVGGAGGASAGSANQSSGCPASEPIQNSFCGAQNRPCQPTELPGCSYGICSDEKPATNACCRNSHWEIERRVGCPVACRIEREALADFAAVNANCQADADCTLMIVACGRSSSRFCNGWFYVNNSADSLRLSELSAALERCEERVGLECDASCDAPAPVPACIDGTCRAGR